VANAGNPSGVGLGGCVRDHIQDAMERVPDRSPRHTLRAAPSCSFVHQGSAKGLGSQVPFLSFLWYNPTRAWGVSGMNRNNRQGIYLLPNGL